MKLVVDESGFTENGLGNGAKEALKTYTLNGENMDMKDIEWRGWQRDLR